MNQDTHWMHRALSLARRGIGLASPNPAVGCVIVDPNGELIGEGWHEYDLLDHAEIAALKNAGCPIHSAAAGVPSERSSSLGWLAEWVGTEAATRLRNSTAYVTLEPCNHTGRTGPCTQALIAAGVSRVVAATADPNPTVAGHGMQTLSASGIQTNVGVCEAEARSINEGFAKWIRHKRPFVHMKVAMTLDGRIAPSPESRTGREPFWITSEESRAAVQQLRHQADAVLTGIDTVLTDDPLLTDRSGLRRRRTLLRVVLDSTLRIPLHSKIVSSAQNDLLVFTVSTDEVKTNELRTRGVRVEVLPGDGGRVPLPKVLDQLGAEGILTLLTETGTRLNTAFIAQNLVDRVQFFVSPQIMGSGAVPAFELLPAPIRMEDVQFRQFANDVCLSSLLRDPWKLHE